MSAYPPAGFRPVDFRYLTPLVLVRDIKAVQARSGEDADYVLGADYRVALIAETPSRRHEITVPAGFLTDLASVPRLARSIVGRVGPHLEASIVHDWLYVAWQIEKRRPHERLRAVADEIFSLAMMRAGVPWLRRQAIFGAVRAFGGQVFRSPQRGFIVVSVPATDGR